MAHVCVSVIAAESSDALMFMFKPAYAAWERVLGRWVNVLALWPQVRNVILRALQQSQIDKAVAAVGTHAAAARAAQMAVECVFDHCLQVRARLHASDLARPVPSVEASNHLPLDLPVVVVSKP